MRVRIDPHPWLTTFVGDAAVEALAAGVGKGALYRRFPDRAHLARAALGRPDGDRGTA